MSRLRVLAFAGGPLGAALLDVLESHPRCAVVGVVVSPAGGGARRPDPFASAWAARRGLPHPCVPTWRDPGALAAIEGIDADLLYSLAYDLILPRRC
jgi:hypothetical protein